MAYDFATHVLTGSRAPTITPFPTRKPRRLLRRAPQVDVKGLVSTILDEAGSAISTATAGASPTDGPTGGTATDGAGTTDPTGGTTGKPTGTDTGTSTGGDTGQGSPTKTTETGTGTGTTSTNTATDTSDSSKPTSITPTDTSILTDTSTSTTSTETTQSTSSTTSTTSSSSSSSSPTQSPSETSSSITSSSSSTTPLTSPISTTPEPSSSSSSSFSFSVTSVITTTDSTGHTSTFTTIVGTNLAPDNSRSGDGSPASTTRAVAIGAGVGGLMLLLAGLAVLFVVRRRKITQAWSRDLFARKGKRPLLAAEFDDQRPRSSFSHVPLHSRSGSSMSAGPMRYSPEMGFAPPGVPGAQSHASQPSWSARPGDPFAPQTPPTTLGMAATGGSPRVMRARGSETGSVFAENVWPPPSERSRLVDPLLAASSQVSLHDIVDDVMGHHNIPATAPPSSYPRRGVEPGASVVSLGQHSRADSEHSPEDASLLGQGSVGTKPNWVTRKVRYSTDSLG